MASVKYSYSKICFGPKLEKEIRASAILVSLDYINVNSSTGTDVWFKASISEADNTILDTLISIHNSTPSYDDPVVSTNIIELPPFAAPTYRTKRQATNSWVTCLENAATNIDFKLLEELYVFGGEVVLKNIKEGDFLSAEIYDADGVIPVPYRAALCENYPTVAKYVIKKWLTPDAGYSSFIVNTYPLNAKITTGLYMRVTYTATAEAGDRKCAVNYYMAKKL